MIGFAYGLGTISGSERGGHLALTVNGDFEAGQQFLVTAYINNPLAGEKVTLVLPEKLERASGNAEEPVPPLAKDTKDGNSIVTWKIKSLVAGEFPVKVRSSSGAEASKTVTIAANNSTKDKLVEVPDVLGLTAAAAKGKLVLNGLDLKFEGSPEKAPAKDKQFTVMSQDPRAGAKVKHGAVVTVQVYPRFEEPSVALDPDAGLFTLALEGPMDVGKAFTLTATVKKPRPDQTLMLKLPDALERVGGNDQMPVPVLADKAASSVSWTVKINKAGEHLATVKSDHGLEQTAKIFAAKPPVKTGPFTALDAQRALKMAVKLIEVDLSYDLDGDGRVTSADAVLIMRRALESK